MTDHDLLGAADMTSRTMSETPLKIMGGKHTLLFGD
ncbi:hypothetical protein F441_09982 [Phytophthora nicotianae CJ01A1]|uniref:Uncharacterized protein n=3 Tax=Phytophthora nicotianae TaxID=4792 RepID=W2Z875_PHYNI|nr:hypothetical protein F444_10129 [Phytophthora nicotianae P1976]ETP15198.1 hypothetical protein F441_09982 [Phytophthora nicotianae CJ01A1]ETP43250.1 hypothetical protein F442_09943 [Phytophthora nicotianae P10297]